MLISRNVFRGYDIRGEYPTDINAEAAEKIGKGFATLMKRVAFLLLSERAL